MKFLKKVFVAVGVVVVVLVVIALASGGSSKKGGNESSSSAKQEQVSNDQEQASDDQKDEAKDAEGSADADAECTVTIDSATVGTDYSDDPCVFVTYTFTNVSHEEPTSFAVEYDADVYQNGIECELAFADTGDDSNYMTKIKAGNSINVTLAYELQDTTSDVEVEVKELFAWDNEIIASQTFHIA